MFHASAQHRTPFLYAQPRPPSRQRQSPRAVLALTVASAALLWLAGPDQAPPTARVIPAPPPAARPMSRPGAPHVAPRAKASAPRPAPVDPRRVGLLAALSELEAEGTLARASRGLDLTDSTEALAAMQRHAEAVALASRPASATPRRGAECPEAQSIGSLTTTGTGSVTYGEKPAPRIVLDEPEVELAAQTPPAPPSDVT